MLSIRDSPFEVLVDQSTSDSSNTVLSNVLGENGLTDAVVGHKA